MSTSPTQLQTELFDTAVRTDLLPHGAAAATKSQWKLDSLQVVNWGGFEGYHRLPFHPVATLLSGGSGTGKSTLLDAYTALMMPSSVAFNGASNDFGTGRARNEAGGQRTLLTYLRGKQGVNDETGGSSSEYLLRGKGEATWGAVAATFVDISGSTYSALRLFFVPASAVDVATITGRMATYPGRIDLRDLAGPMSQHTAGKPLALVITSTWPGAKVTGKYNEFSNVLFTHLGIGANGDGAKALDLLARIQAGRPVNSVNALYRDLVLDTPATFRNADLALDHFDTLADDLARMVEAERKHTTLCDIREVYDKLTSARERAVALDQYGIDSPGFTKLTAWSLRKEGDLLDAAADLARERHQAAEEATRAAWRDVEAMWEDLETARKDYRDSGGDELANLDGQIEQLAGDLAIAHRNREELLEHVAAVESALTSRGDFDALQGDARRFASEREKWADDHEQRRDALRDQLKPLTDRKNNLTRDLEHLEKSGTRIRSTLGGLRDQVASRVGMKPYDLPFLAELIDLRPGEERWRTAIETVLAGDASRIVIPIERRREIARAINDMTVGRQVRLIDGTAGTPLRYPLEGVDSADQRGRILSKLQFADHPYVGWVQEHLGGSGLNALCVDTPDELDGGGFRVTATGQTRSGIRSAIGRNSSDDIIGFSSAEEIEKVTAERQQVERELAAVVTGLENLKKEARKHDARVQAYAAIARFRWEEVDVDGITGRIAKLKERQDALRSADDKLGKLASQIEELKSLHQEAQLEHAKRSEAARALNSTWSKLIEDKDKMTNALAPYEFNDAFDLTEEQAIDLAEVYAAAVAHADAGEDAIEEAHRFGERLGVMRQQLLAQAASARSEVADGERALTRTFVQYRTNWPDSNLGETHASYPDYLRVLEELEAKGLYETREEWQRTVAQWSGEDLLPLSQSLSSEVDAIKARVAPINDILETLPFGARRGRLKLKVDDVRSESVRQFRVKLRRMTTLATKQMSFEETRKAFAELSAFMDLLRDPKDPRYNTDRSDRARLLDVRRHVEVYAVEYPTGADIWQAREHRQLGSASGGESQELIAFIIGSALRFRLGDELRDEPRFAPVFLDEGFVKADSEFAGRAVGAWRALGFQIIVGTPEDKFTGLERHMDSFVVVYKDQVTGYSYIDHVLDHEANQALGRGIHEGAAAGPAVDGV